MALIRGQRGQRHTAKVNITSTPVAPKKRGNTASDCHGGPEFGRSRCGSRRAGVMGMLARRSLNSMTVLPIQTSKNRPKTTPATIGK